MLSALVLISVLTLASGIHTVVRALNLASASDPDVAVLDAGAARLRIPDPVLGMIIPVFVTVENQGSWFETFEVSAFYDTTLIGWTWADLEAGWERTYSFRWDLDSLPEGVYTISANASILSGETDTADNSFVNGDVLKALFADVTGDGSVDVFDLCSLGKAYESTAPAGDLNSDGIVNYTDVHTMGAAMYPYPDFIYNPYADLDGDGNVDYDDFNLLAMYFGHTGDSNWNLHADMNADNAIDLSDLLALSQNYGTTGP